MAEKGCRFKGFKIVTVGTGGPEVLLVVVGMAGGTLRLQSQVGELLLPDSRIVNEGGLVAFGTQLFRMYPRQFEPGQVVIELLLCKAHNLKVLAMVIAVTCDAVLTPDLN